LRVNRQTTWRLSRLITSWGQRQLQRPSWQRLQQRQQQQRQHQRPGLLRQERQVPKRQQQARMPQQVLAQLLVRVRELALQQVQVLAQERALPSCRKLRGRRLR
jgi:hypothetical protein